MATSATEKSKAGKRGWRLWVEVYIINKMIRAVFPRGCLREAASWIFVRKAFQVEGVGRATVQRGEWPGVLREVQGAQLIWRGGA